MYNFEGKHQRYLASMQYKTRVGYLDYNHNTFFATITTQNTLIKWKSGFWTYTTRHTG